MKKRLIWGAAISLLIIVTDICKSADFFPVITFEPKNC